jgi:S1-C subfamily serine protease
MRLTVGLADGAESPADGVGDEADTDLAHLRVGAASRLSLAQAALGRSYEFKRGEIAIAVGNRFGFAGFKRGRTAAFGPE